MTIFNMVLSILFALLLVVFITDYTRHAKWWKNRIGINLVLAYNFKLVLLATLAMARYEIALESLPYIKSVAILGLMWTVAERIYLMRRAQHLDSTDKNDA